jgi:hypothetical protein
VSESDGWQAFETLHDVISMKIGQDNKPMEKDQKDKKMEKGGRKWLKDMLCWLD